MSWDEGWASVESGLDENATENILFEVLSLSYFCTSMTADKIASYWPLPSNLKYWLILSHQIPEKITNLNKSKAKSTNLPQPRASVGLGRMFSSLPCFSATSCVVSIC